MATPAGSFGWYRALLWCLPHAFRRERQAELERLFRDMEEEVAGRSLLLRLVFWSRCVLDVLIRAVSERLHPSRPRRPSDRPHRGEFMATLFQDLRYALRTVVRPPTYGLMIVTMMALGIAGNAAVFRIFNGLFLRPLPFERSEELIDLDETAPQWDLEYVGIAYPDFVGWRRSNETFSGMAVYSSRGANFADETEAERIQVVASSYDLATVLGLEPTLGRFFTEEEDRPDAPNVAMLARDFWRQRFASDPAVIGRTVQLNGRPFEVIGVLPEEAGFIADVAMWVPLGLDPVRSGGWYLAGVGRLKPGVTVEQAAADLLAVHRGMIETRHSNDITSPILTSIRERYLGEFRLGGAVLLGAVTIVLLIACANIAGLMLARSIARSREMAIRVAMGAGRGRIVRQLLTESLLLAVAGATLGTVLGVFGSAVLVERMSEQFPAWVTFDLDWRFVAFTLAATTGAAVVFGLAPALQAARVGPGGILQSSGVRAGGSIAKRRGMSVLVTGEIALALILLIVAGLSVRDVRQLQRVDPGFEADNLLSYSLSLPSAKYENGEQRAAFFEEHLERVRVIPGVLGATAASNLPLQGHWGWFFQVEGAPERAPDEPNPVVLNRSVTPGYLQTMGVTLFAGRDLQETDGRNDGSRAVVVNETFVRQFFPDDPVPLGRRVSTDGETWLTVVGVTRDVKHYGVDEEMRPGVYQPLAQLQRASLQFAVRTAGDPMALMNAIRAAVREADPEIPVYQIATMRETIGDALWTRRALSWLIAAFSSVALVLALAGIYGVVSYSVGQRSHEISIRMALGARGPQVVNQLLRQGMVLVGVGIGAGLVLSFAAARVVSSMLVGVPATDPLVFGATTVALLLVAALANFLPAQRASKSEPMRALREE